MPPERATRVWQFYLALGLVQAAHSVEEMLTRLYEFFAVIHSRFPAFPLRGMSAETFITINLLLIALLLGTVPAVRAGRDWARLLAGLAAVVEIVNGASHLSLAWVFGGYIPGVITAPVLLLTGLLLLRELWRASQSARPR